MRTPSVRPIPLGGLVIVSLDRPGWPDQEPNLHLTGTNLALHAKANWVLLDGYNDGAGRPLTQLQRVTSETIGDADCKNPQPIPSADGRQHYLKWNIPAAGYCLDATGTIKPPNGSTTVHFRHLQKRLPPHPCSNPYYTGQSCITQFEQWWDDNQHSYALQLSRTVEIARGLGMAFTKHTTVPVTWNADGRYFWHY